ncbi:MAG: hypothetical protein COV44_07500 [Deltaproteobacteria bacterium CG11_big_fil_rev_8_21_14_0_20_45_16]|nr:MAG: hypothetical protein COV44_07500 [Deltaproteobacteria bacterium CG11_big_fil_rev_8_21_14_0_20_45_16]
MKGGTSDIKSSILEALQEEKQSPVKRARKILNLLAAISIPVVGILWFSFRGEFNLFWLVSLIVWLGIAASAAFFFWKPQPRIIVPGFWTSWMYGKLLILFLLISAIQLLVCPHLAMISPSPHFSINVFEPMQEMFMSWGGMASCMFFCGLSFSAIATAISLFIMRRAATGARSAAIFRISSIAVLAQFPIIILQISDAHLRSHFALWLLGSFLGVLSLSALFSILFKKISYALSH